MFELNKIVRPNVLKLKPYSSARDDFKASAEVWLDANESGVDSGYNRYPDPHQVQLKQAIAQLKQVSANQIFLGNGSDEAIDLLVRAFCNPGADKIMILTPTYGMYQVVAGINDVELIDVPLTADFQPNETAIEAFLDDAQLKIIFFCSPNNPTGNVMDKATIKRIATKLNGLVVVDEAYVDLCPEDTVVNEIGSTPNLVVLQTFSKAWGMAALRLGMAFADKAIIDLLNKIKPPYNINSFTQSTMLQRLAKPSIVKDYKAMVDAERELLTTALKQLGFVNEVYPSKANFMLVAFNQAKEVYQHLASNGIVVRDRSSVVPNTLRITIGLPKENEQLIASLKAFES